MVDAPYMYLTEAEKEHDRIWARKAYEICAQVARVLNDKEERDRAAKFFPKPEGFIGPGLMGDEEG